MHFLKSLISVGLLMCQISSCSFVRPNSTASARTLNNITINQASPASLESMRADVSSKFNQPISSSFSSHLHKATPSAAVNATHARISSARALVAAAHATQAAYNKWRLTHPYSNTRRSKHSAGTSKRKTQREEVFAPVLSAPVIDAITLIGHVDAIAAATNGTLKRPFTSNTTYTPRRKADSTNFRPKTTMANSKRDAADFWMANLQHAGKQPFGGDDFYEVWRNVRDYGAIGDGIADDTDAINLAISDGNRCGIHCESSSVKGALVYFPMGTYRVTSPIISYYNTQLVGALDPDGPAEGGGPTILAGSTFTGFGVITSDVYLPGGDAEWYIEQSNFYRQIRNFQIDLRQATLDQIAGIHWQVAQATSIQNVYIIMTDASVSTQVGIWGENGSGGWMSEISFFGGWYGFLGGNQQYTVSGLTFYGCKNGVGLIWDWAWTWHDITFVSCETAIDLNPPGASQSNPVGSIYLMDVNFVSCNTMIYTFPFARGGEQGTTVFTFDNIRFSGNTYFVRFTNGGYFVSDVMTTGSIDFATIGDVQYGEDLEGFFNINVPTRPEVLADLSQTSPKYAQWGWLRRPKPSYYQVGSENFFNVKWYAAGDGRTDDTEYIQLILNFCADNGYIVFFPAGSYMISSPITIPVNSYIVGEVWSQLVAYGSYFTDEQNPQPMIIVGGNGVTGPIEIQDMLFTSVGYLPGLVLLYWDVNADSQGSAAMWDCHFRVGGALGTNLQVAQCPKLRGEITFECMAASILMLIPPTGNGYFENVWLWVADHDLDDYASTQIDVYVGRGLMCETSGPSWFWGTASEHSVLYQYNFIESTNVFASMIQTESPYFQGAAATQAPRPYQLLWNGDPSFDMCGSLTTSCNVAWAVIIQSSRNIFINGAGLYSWFKNYDQACVNTVNCQQRLINIYDTKNLWFNHIVTIGSVEVVTPAISNPNNDIIYAVDVTQALQYPWWTTIAAYLDSSSSDDDNCPVCPGIVAWGDSFSSGVGAGLPYDAEAMVCKRGTGGYPSILNKLITDFFGLIIDFQFLACSGQKVSSFLELSGKGKQFMTWEAGRSSIALMQFFINDANLGDIIRSCMIGYSKIPCDTALLKGENYLLASTPDIDLWFQKVVGVVLASAFAAKRHRFLIYWVGYPSMFETLDHACDNSRFQYWPSWFGWRYRGEYLSVALRERFNSYIYQLNGRIRSAVANWNAGLPYHQVEFLEPDVNIYTGARFCEPGVSEPKAKNAQDNVKYFYPDGPDYIPPGFTLPAQMKDAIGSWDVPEASLTSVNSGTCEGDEDLLEENAGFLCELTQQLAADTSQIPAFQQANVEQGFGDVVVTVEVDGSVTIAAFSVRWLKMFHVKTSGNIEIAQLIARSVRWN